MYDNKVSKRQAEVILPYTTTMSTPLRSALIQESNDNNRSTPPTAIRSSATRKHISLTSYTAT